MARMVVDAEFLLENLGQDGRGPNAGVQSVSYRAAVHDVMELLPLGFGEFARATTAIAFLDALQALRIPAANPSVNAAAVDLQQIRNLRWRVARHTEQKGLQTQRDTGGLVALRLLAQCQQLAASTGITFGEDWFHSIPCRATKARTLVQRSYNINGKTQKRAPSSAERKRRNLEVAALPSSLLDHMSLYLSAVVLCPFARSDELGYQGGGNKFDFER